MNSSAAWWFLLSAVPVGVSMVGCASSSSEARRPDQTPHADVRAPGLGESVRVGGDREIRLSGDDGDYAAGGCSIDTPLPAGYPRPTPPGAIELKAYPVVRVAEVAGEGDPDRGMNRAFWPLFNHIKSHEIAMTSPVEMNYRGVREPAKGDPESWSMAFLYRQPELNTTGVEGAVVVRDAPAVTVVAIGMKGNYSMSLVRRGMEELGTWLEVNPEWEPAGDWRALYYNGPSLFWWNKWAEVQIPVRRSDVSDASADAVRQDTAGAH